MEITDSQVEMNRRLYSGQQVGLMGVPIGKPTSPSPIRTRREIVPGMYGRVNVVREEFGTANIGIIDRNNVSLTTNFTAEELREAAHILNQLAEVLEENQ